MNLISFPCVCPDRRTIDVPAGTVLWILEENKTRLRETLAREVEARSGLRAGTVRIVSRSGMKPRVEIAGRPSAEWHVSLSYAHRCCAGALSLGRAVGIDLEWIDPGFRWEPVAVEFFPPGTTEIWNQLPPGEARQEFFRHWVRWEAALKCRGLGFGATHRSAATATQGLSVFDLDLAAGYAGCLALALTGTG